MKETKKAVVKAEAAKVESVVKSVAEKAVPAAKAVAKEAEPVAKAVAEKAVTAKKAVKTTAKKAVAKKETVDKKETTAQAEVKATVSVQFDGKSYTTEKLVEIAKDVWKYDLQKKESDFQTVELFVKPEESVAYYVINGEVSGSFGI